MTLAAFRTDGVARFPGFAGADSVEALRAEFERLAALPGGLARSGAVFAIRGLFSRSRPIAAIAREGRWPLLAARLLGAPARAIRAVFFDKTPDANWPLPWHQDRTAALRWETLPDGFCNATVKDGQTKAELPLDWLRATVALRLHLDPADAESGALRVAPGRHRGPLLDDTDLRALADEPNVRTVAAQAGDLVAMSPLTPHASNRVRRDCRRRVLHIEFCAKPLPEGVSWAETA